MKIIFKLLGLAVVIVLSSCGSSNMIVLKRKYNTGYYVDFNTKKATKSANATAVVKQQENTSSVSESKETSTVEETVASETNQQNMDYPVTASNDKNIYVISAKKAKSVELINSTVVSDKDQNFAPVNKSKFSIKAASKINHIVKKSPATTNQDSLFILEVILSFFPFLALIAMYLKDGKQITNNFWIDLILHLTFVGYIIYALLVVLDVINLA